MYLIIARVIELKMAVNYIIDGFGRATLDLLEISLFEELDSFGIFISQPKIFRLKYRKCKVWSSGIRQMMFQIQTGQKYFV